jgi:hypothetical protein
MARWETKTAVTSLSGSEQIPITQGGVDKRVSPQQLANANEGKASNISSAATTDIGAASAPFVHVTGTTTISSLGTVQAGTRRIVVFDGALTLTYNATSLILPTGANITTAAGDVATFVSEGSGNWRCVDYTKADGTSLVGGGVTDGDKGDITVSDSGATWTIENGAVSYAKMQDVSATQRVIGRNSAGAGDPQEVTLSQLLDWVGSAANGDILIRSGGAWTRLAVGSNGQVLTVASGLPAWAASSGGGSSDTVEVVDTQVSTSSTSYSSTGVTFSVTSGTYILDAYILYQTSATTTGIGIGAQTSGSSDVFKLNLLPLTLTTGFIAGASNIEQPNPSTAVPASGFTYLARAWMVIRPAASETLDILFRTEVAGSAVYLNAGSVFILRKAA